MAIKLADVIENINTSYPVLETHGKHIVGLFNGHSSNSAQSVEVTYNGATNIKANFTADGVSSTDYIKIISDYAAATGANLVTADDDNAFLSENGGLFTARDAFLRNDSDVSPGAGSEFAGLYMVQAITSGTDSVVPAARSSVATTSELVQQFNRYPTLPNQSAPDGVSLASIIENEEDLWLAGYDVERKRTRKFGIDGLIAAIAAEIGTNLIGDGIISTTDAGGSGAVGDLNGDGIVSISDLLILMGSFGGGNEALNYVSKFRTLTESGDAFTITPTDSLSNSGSGNTYQWGDIGTFDMPSDYSVNNAVYGWSSFNSPINGPNYLELEGKSTGSTAQDWFEGKRLRAVFSAKVQGPVADFVFVFLRVRVTMTGGQKYEQVYYMNPIGAANNSFFWYGLDFNSTPGQAIGVDWFYSSNNQQFVALDYEATDSGVTESGIMQDNTWTLTSTTGNFISPTNSTSGQIDDIELRFGCYSYTGLTELVVSRMHAYVDHEAYDYIHPQ